MHRNAKPLLSLNLIQPIFEICLIFNIFVPKLGFASRSFRELTFFGQIRD